MHRSNVHRSKECTMECGQITLCIPTEHCTFNIPVQVTILYNLHLTAHCTFQQSIVHFLYMSHSCTFYILQHIVHSNRNRSQETWTDKRNVQCAQMCTDQGTVHISTTSMNRVGQNCIHTPYMTIHLVNSLEKTPYIHCINMVFGKPYP